MNILSVTKAIKYGHYAPALKTVAGSWFLAKRLGKYLEFRAATQAELISQFELHQ